MQEMQHPDGTVSREFFSDAELKRGDMARRRKELEKQGYSITRVAYIMKKSRYMPHIGKQECERRLRQIQRAEAKRAEVA